MTTLAGCSAIFGLESPKLRDAAAADAPKQDAMSDGGPSDGGPSDSGSTAACPSDYAALPFAQSMTKYRFVDTQATAVNALVDCANDLAGNSSLHTHGVVLANNAELDAISSLTQMNDVWVGLSDAATEGTLLWVTDEPSTYPPTTGVPWAVGEPSNTDTQDCVILSQGALSMKNCGITKRYVCECDAYPIDPAHF